MNPDEFRARVHRNLREPYYWLENLIVVAALIANYTCGPLWFWALIAFWFVTFEVDRRTADVSRRKRKTTQV